jgi:hypothetical protein
MAEVAVVKHRASDVVRSLDGFDEIAIEQKFHAEVSALSELKTMRALVFVIKRREGKSDQTAFAEVMKMSIGQVGDVFESEEIDDEGND